MAIVGFSFTKIHAEKKGPLQGKVNIQNNVGITDLKEYKLNIGKNSELGIRFIFKYTTDYSPNVGSLEFEGEVLWLGEEKDVKEMLQNWKKDKKIDQEVMVPILNNVLTKANIQALNISQDLGLPAPLQLPKVNVKNPEK